MVSQRCRETVETRVHSTPTCFPVLRESAVQTDVKVCRVFRVKQVEEENSEMSLSLSRLKSQTEKLDEVSSVYVWLYFVRGS